LEATVTEELTELTVEIVFSGESLSELGIWCCISEASKCEGEVEGVSFLFLEMEVPFGEESLIARIVGEARLQSAIFFFAYQNLVLVF
jgi:hypothetical protein